MDRSPGGTPGSAAEARTVARDVLVSQDRPVDESVAVDVSLVVSELVTNAFRHGGGLTGFHTFVRDEAIEILVDDASERVPAEQPRTEHGAPGGYGWPLVRRMASEVSIVPLPGGGKRIRVLIPLGPCAEKESDTAGG
ncbi:ATP-binding protein [Streptomyces tsukubensis]|uniref:Histidine kinase/HSP90-like ATPase domain-containing protein n=1 Tax=Streptomyces tsukubensis TaxID=83656 RepID=A0A1V4A7G2_9ACTN|nr:hypothetical protein B1H18_18590 [Streptomyces tsukubensis]QFR97505.1 ATP-binding protein [Streptomyces tsukubensis]